MHDESWNASLTHDITILACTRLFADYGVELERQASSKFETSTDAMLHVGVIGFTGDGVRGTLVLATSEGPLRRSNPAREARFDRDWIAELSNQLLGRIKREYLARGVTIYLTTPVVLRGIRITTVPRVDEEPIVLSAADGVVRTWIEVEFNEGIRLAEHAASQDAGLGEGSAVMFDALDPLPGEESSDGAQ